MIKVRYSALSGRSQGGSPEPGKGGFMMKNKKTKGILAVTIPVLLLALSAAYLVYRLLSEKAYEEKWKDYHDCGLA